MTTFVLIPGAGGAAWYWSRVVRELRERGHEAVAVDLPADDDRAGLREYANVVEAAVGDRRDPVLVSQSMGAFTAPIVAERVGASMIVLVNPMVPAPGESAGSWWEATGQTAAMLDHARAIGLEELSFDDLEALFGHDVPSAVWTESGEYQRDQSGTPFGEPWPLERWPRIPTRVLVSRDDRLFPLQFQRRVVSHRLGLAPDEIDGGHLVALSRPGELANRLEEYATHLVLAGR